MKLVIAAVALVALACVDPPPRLEDAKPPSVAPVSAAATVTPRPKLAIDSEMDRWAREYVALMTPAGAVVLSINAVEPDRETCNALIAAVYNARNQLRTASDPDVASAVKIGFDNASDAGSACLRGEGALRDTHLVLAGAGFHLAEKLAAERYHVSLVVRGISDVIGGEQESAITQRAINGARGLQAKAQQSVAAAAPEEAGGVYRRQRRRLRRRARPAGRADLHRRYVDRDAGCDAGGGHTREGVADVGHRHFLPPPKDEKCHG